MKEGTFYFTHDYNARLDEKIKMLLRKHGMLGYGIYWAIIEDLYNNANALRLDCEGIAFEYRVDECMIKSVINDFNLFVFEGDFFGSLSVQRRMNERESKSVKARLSAFKRWENANALPTHSERNAIKEKKGKESKGKEKRVNSAPNGFSPPLLDEVIQYFSEKGFPAEIAKKAFEYYHVSDWKDSKGNKVKNWKQKMLAVWMKEENKPNQQNQNYGIKPTIAERARASREQAARELANPIIIDPNTDFFSLPKARTDESGKS